MNSFYKGDHYEYKTHRFFFTQVNYLQSAFGPCISKYFLLLQYYKSRKIGL